MICGECSTVLGKVWFDFLELEVQDVLTDLKSWDVLK